jgi:hypothetical protein
VFTLNAKNHPNAKLWIAGDTFLVNGQRHPYIRNSRFEAFRAAGLLTSAAGIKVDATGVVVPVGAAGVGPQQRLEVPPRPLATLSLLGPVRVAVVDLDQTALKHGLYVCKVHASRPSTPWTASCHVVSAP